MTLPLTDLPVEECVSQLSSALFNARRAVLVAPPGSGKTTLAPLRLLETSWLLPNERIVMLEPRKLAARAAARRMAHMLGEKVGDTVGYQTRDERVIGPNTRIEVLTEGVLTRRLQSDPDLPNVGIVIFDEVHERNLPGDLGLALLLHAQESLGSQQRILLMSATPDTDRWCTYLGSAAGEPAPVISSTGTLFPVEVHWWRSPTVRKGQRRDDERLENKVATTVVRALRETEGDILVFLPGIGEIRRAITATESVTEGAVDLFPLAGALSLEEQDAALAPSRPGRRRIVFSTDIAESSLTVDGVRVVIDSGIARAPRFDPRTGMTRLTTVNISQASATNVQVARGDSVMARHTGSGHKQNMARVVHKWNQKFCKSTSLKLLLNSLHGELMFGILPFSTPHLQRHLKKDARYSPSLVLSTAKAPLPNSARKCSRFLCTLD